MERENKVAEKVLYEIWKNRQFIKELVTLEGDEVTILDVGIENIDASGPDFKNSRIRIGNLTYVGDVEIDKDIRDWKAHGHNLDRKYNSVILHVTLKNKSNYTHVFNKNGRKIPSVCLSQFVDNTALYELQNNRDSDDTQVHNLKCSDQSANLDSTITNNFLLQLGTDRFKKKCDKVYFRLKELAFLKQLNIKEPVIQYDLNHQFLMKEFTYQDFNCKDLWLQLFYEMVFEALGYSKNKNSMLELAQTVTIKFLNSISDNTDSIMWINSCLFNIAGLMPELEKNQKVSASDYVKNLNEKWAVMKVKYDGNMLSNSQWHFFKLRPQNFPTIRIAGGSVIIYKLLYENLLPKILQKFEEANNISELSKTLKSFFIIKAYGFWKNHYIFDQSSNGEINYFIGSSRADEIVVNVILPYMSIYSEIFGKKNISEKIFQVFSDYYQNDNNNIVKFVAESLSLNNSWKKSILSQGMIELFRNYCSKNRCLECKIGETLFN